jgi:hypothetical protein
MIENWIDLIAAVWGDVSDGKGGTVRSYRMYEVAEFPASLSEFPCAVSYPTKVVCEYGAGNSIDLWDGKTEFHLVPNIDRAHTPYLLQFFARIRDAAALHMTLGGVVDYFILRMEDKSIEGPVELKWGGEEPHWGLVVYWRVKENVSNQVVIE